MKLHRHLLILDMAVTGLLKRRSKSAVLLISYSCVVFLLGSILFLTDALRRESGILLDGAPDLIVQKIRGGRHDLIPAAYAEEISRIRGVAAVVPRFWGYYYDPPTKANYTFLGIGPDTVLPEGVITGDLPSPGTKGECLIGQGVYDARFVDVDDIIPVKKSDGGLHVLRVRGVFTAASSLMTNDLVVMNISDVTTIFDMPEGTATDLAVTVPNAREIETVAWKIFERLPDTRSVSKEQLRRTYDAVFDWRSGLVSVIFLAALMAFCVLAWDKATGLTEEEKREVGLLRASGWTIPEVIELKLHEGAVLSLCSFLTGTIAAYAHVFFAGGSLFRPVLKGWSVLFPEFTPLPTVDLFHIGVLALLTIAPYVGVTLLPVWKAAATEPDAVMRG